MLFSNIIAF